ncbi:sigma 54-interacting transcriptional regulator [Leptolyngbya sp. 7M]|uniref:sigma 54-interacting transcriptional regulator n=1 Tax=Leptolyngbya sp. 7M TaxID=2812896 RepID=UPI001B8BFD9D|nr:sigma 54-interacting transcriptional regulator [Leptolyngbya sp. 7M]QYO66034.1 sigma 54-interacting transcriptional regulator [Leptolyngbya sp. 7M]
MAFPTKKTDPLEIAAYIADRLTAANDVRDAIRKALEALRKELELRAAVLFLNDHNGDNLSIAESAGIGVSEFRRLDARVVRSRIGEAFSISEKLGPLPMKDDYELNDVFNDLDGASLAAVPVMISGAPVGMLAVFGIEITHTPVIELAATMFAQALRIEHSVRGERERLREENLLLKHELKEKYEFDQIIGNSGAIRHVYEQVSQVARSNATVLLRGESGTGKELIANAIHYNSLRGKKPLVKVNCAALPESLIETELFGHEKGAFTGADRARKGRFELAEGGTLFLDEIGDLPLQTQVKLLRVLQEREFERIGGAQTIKTNIRLITATNKDLEKAISKGEFREDLYYRLNVFSIFLPPLRERRSDILLLAEHFLEKYEAEHNKRIRRISTPAIDMLMSYHFPGNVRELENAIERAVLVCDSNVIHGHHLPPTLQTAEVTGTVTELTLESAVASFERDLILDALKSNNGNIAKASRSLGSTERIIGYKIRKYGIDTKRFKK